MLALAFMMCWVQVSAWHETWCVLAHTYNPSTQVLEAGALAVQDNPWLYREFEVSLDHMRLHVQTNINKDCEVRKLMGAIANWLAFFSLAI